MTRYFLSKPLPEVFGESIMKPVGASKNWRWVGYDNAWVEINGRKMQSVPGGSHWGGGVSNSSIDQALIGRLLLDDGKAGDEQVVSSDWMRRMRTPCAIAPFYGYLVWFNHGGRIFPSIPESSFFAIGAGSSFTWIEPENRMVVVVRWIDAAYADAFFKRVFSDIEI